MSMTVLLADREPMSRGLLEQQLRHVGFELVVESDGRPDLVIAGDDAELERWCGEAPVIVLGSPESTPDARVRAFRLGCDDYVARPFDCEELVERVRAVIRRSRPPVPNVIVAGPIEIDPRIRIVSVHGKPIAVSHKEYLLLLRLASDPLRVFTKAELLREIWGYAASARTRTLDSHASRLRRKLRALDPATPFIDNEWGVGYRLIGLHPEQ
jgi:DNA-binding response OmpR family regulator